MVRRRAVGWAMALTGLLAPVVVLTPAVATPGQAPTTQRDRVVVAPGATARVAVLTNDRVYRKRRAQVTVLRTPPRIRARGTVHRRVLVRVGPRAAAGTYRIPYRVTDVHGRTARGILRVVVRAGVRSLSAAVADLRVEPEVRTGYDRARFKHWVDADRDGCDTRSEVLLAEAVTPVAAGTACPITNARSGGGRWVSYYDGVTTTSPTGFDIDHLVPLAEAWDSGARRWTDARREAFANDLDDPRSLVAVSASSNRSKSDRDPAEWLPPRPAAHCRYVGEWVAVKLRWELSVDVAERDALRAVSHGCDQATVRVVPVR
ncbi:HNH endonuclease family protein [Nocardioides massiliensis]|uniref:GmrSD restriction endonucleases C-terminal domain-containing protein n=1 Tax=Nocardioides massiliensis TaxID=1325935 RepID=A0ABT9NPC9_9ACTN|nr:HNH endonuclease family protein [Nocardioides massiliensis]MDP9822264.1 hypothetical protein [Nocardioides massiliensis]